MNQQSNKRSRRSYKDKNYIDEATFYSFLKKIKNINIKDSDGETLLTCSLVHYPNVVPQILQFRADFNLANSKGVTPLMKAFWHAHYDLVQLLIQQGANASIQNLSGQNILFHGTSDFSKLQPLIDAGADVNTKDFYGNTPLISSILNGQPQIELFMQNGADINTQNNEGNTAIMVALNCNYKNDNFKDIEKLLNFFPDVSLKNFYNETALDIAYKNYLTSTRENQKQIYELLQSATLKGTITPSVKDEKSRLL